MEAAALCLLLFLNSLGSGFARVSLTITPNRSQFFKYDSFSLRCEVEEEEEEESNGWIVKKMEGELDSCLSARGTVPASSCTITVAYPSSDSGVYWCESGLGETSDVVNVTITDGAVILESPVLPVMEGGAVTLRCTIKTTPSNLPADFYKDGVLIRTSYTGEMTIHSVSRSDEGLYKCSISDSGESPESWLAVRAFLRAGNQTPTSWSKEGGTANQEPPEQTLLEGCHPTSLYPSFTQVVLLLWQHHQ